MALLMDPRVFNYVIMAMYALNILRWAMAGKLAGRLLLDLRSRDYCHSHFFI